MDPITQRRTGFNFEVRSIVDYDANYLRDRVVSRVFVNDKETGIYAAMALDDEVIKSAIDVPLALERFGEDLERSVIDEFLGLRFREQVTDAHREIRKLQERINHLERTRWWHLRVHLKAARLRAKTWAATEAKRIADRLAA